MSLTASVCAIYSNDHRATWQMGGKVPVTNVMPDETAVTELPNGDLLINSRPISGNLRLSARSADGGLNWTPALTVSSLMDPQCEGSLLTTDYDNSSIVFFSNNPMTTRTKLTIRISKDNGFTWTPQMLIDPVNIYTAYSDLSRINSQQLGIAYEAGKKSYYETIRFKSYMVGSLSN